jgi:hypothetical protein
MFYIKGSKLSPGTLIRFEEDLCFGQAKAGQMGIVIDHPFPARMDVLIEEKVIRIQFNDVPIYGWVSEISLIQ